LTVGTATGTVAGPAAEIAVVGGGPAGLRCAIGVAEAGVSVSLFERQSLGGQLVNARLVEGVVAHAGAVSGPEVSGDLAEEAYDAGVQIDFTDVTSIDHDPEQGWWTLTFSSGVLRSRAVVLATGSRPRTLDVPGAERLAGRGVSYCATCDGPLFKGKSVVVLMRDQWGVDEAVQLADSAASVVALIHPDHDAALERHLSRLDGMSSVEMRPASHVIEVIGDDIVTGIRAVGDRGDDTSWDTDGVFCSLGVVPEAELVAGAIELDATGGVVTDSVYATAVPSMFAVGEVRAGSPHTAAQALADGDALARHLVARLG
jgi:thioredoxin reductase (NADPH)